MVARPRSSNGQSADDVHGNGVGGIRGCEFDSCRGHMPQPKHALVRTDDNGRAVTRRGDAVKRIAAGGANSNRSESVEAEALRRGDETFGRPRAMPRAD